MSPDLGITSSQKNSLESWKVPQIFEPSTGTDDGRTDGRIARVVLAFELVIGRVLKKLSL